MTRTTIAVGVVDNDRLSLEMLKRIVLQQPIFTLKWTVSDSAVAIQSCLDTASRPDVLLTDMALDGMSGAELCNLVHQMAPSVRFVGVTAFPQTPMSSSDAQRPFDIVAKDNFRAIPTAIVNAMRPIPDQAGSNGDNVDNTRGDVNAQTHTRVTVPATPRLSRRTKNAPLPSFMPGIEPRPWPSANGFTCSGDRRCVNVSLSSNSAYPRERRCSCS